MAKKDSTELGSGTTNEHAQKKKARARTTNKADRDSLEEGLKSWETFRKMGAATSKDRVAKVEAAIQADDGVARRLALATLAEPTSALIEKVAKDREFAILTADPALA